MQFVTDNYIWFLIIGIVILMVVIGYIAEKTDFGHKDVGKKEKKDKKKEKELKKLAKSNLKLNDVVYSDKKDEVEVIEDNPVENLSEPLNTVEEDLTVPLNNEKKEEPVEDLTVPLNGVEEDLTVPLSGVKEGPVEDLTVPLNSEVSELPKEPENVEIEETPKDNEEVKSSDDIWKF